MIVRIDWNCHTSVQGVINEARTALDEKGWLESVQVVQFLSIWNDHFQSRFGPLNGTSHLSNPDDPPDAVGHFGSNDIPIEVCSITPGHVKQSDALHRKEGGNRGRYDIPISQKPRNADEAKNWMYGPAGADIYEAVEDANNTVYDSIIGAAKRKFGKASIARLQSGVLLLPGDRLFGSFGEEEVVRAALGSIRKEIPDAKDWIIAVHHQWNGWECFSAIDAPSSGFALRQEVKS
ncbi:hypothetical protein OJ996_05810 [Luteolibacter sp. GHJ8]|uniref:Uncharacterized protein n=1 Tax=Luteolibacter rhizosphaerae TaxID=2989719 RepID=A0ABT3FZS0_9BACT|nr:hypothetical protein [Luteolibacter rhizosphaerae]MCW1913077.1 hypothetical protein [Luteolibacter rhizosphaerae]